MKPKVQCEIQPRPIAPPRSDQVQEEIGNFLQAIDSYPARVAKHPRLTFQQHLCGIVMAHDLRDDARSNVRLRRY